MKYIPLTQGKQALVDDQDYDTVLAEGSWHFDRYAKRVVRVWDKSAKRYRHNGVVYMHRLIMNPPVGMTVDHINGDKLDNRRENLRVCSIKDNTRNSRKRVGKYVGVSFDKRRNKWKATLGSKQYRFDTEVEAAKFRDKLAKEHFGIYARLNFP